MFHDSCALVLYVYACFSCLLDMYCKIGLNAVHVSCKCKKKNGMEMCTCNRVENLVNFNYASAL